MGQDLTQMLGLTGRVAVVTGGGRGIGKQICLTLASAGADVAVLDVLQEEAAKTAEEVRALGRRSEAFPMDVTNSDAVLNVMKEIVARFQTLDILVNNAGITRDNLVLRMSDDEWDKVLAVNLRGAFVCTRAALRYILKSKAGRVINIASVVGIRGNAGQCNYSASKAGLIGFTKSAAREVAGRPITVNAIAPGYIGTQMTKDLPEEAKARMMEFIPAHRIGDPQDVANAALFLASDLAGYVTGHVLAVDGGFAM